MNDAALRPSTQMRKAEGDVILMTEGRRVVAYFHV
jgi:hypothetical protein